MGKGAREGGNQGDAGSMPQPRCGTKSTETILRAPGVHRFQMWTQQGLLEAASICKTRDKVLIYSLFIHSFSQSPNHLSLVAFIWATLLTMWKVLEPFHYSTCLSYQGVPPARGVAKVCVCPLLTSDLSVHICASVCEHVRVVPLAELGKKGTRGTLKEA